VKPQTTRTLDVLRSRGADGLSPDEAREWVGTDRLAARIWELEAEGHVITRTLETSPRGARYARYVLHERPVQLALLDSPDGAADSFPRGSVQVAERRSLVGPGAG